jgi:hypothetical protein
MKILSVSIFARLPKELKTDDVAEAFSFTVKSKRLKCTRVYLSDAMLQFFPGSVMCTACRRSIAKEALKTALGVLGAKLQEQARVVNVFASGHLIGRVDLEVAQKLCGGSFDLTSHRSVLRMRKESVLLSIFRSGIYQVRAKTFKDLREVARCQITDFAQQMPAEWGLQGLA